MAAPKRTPDQVLRDRADITDLYLRGKSQGEIADLLTSATKDGVRVRAYEISRAMVKSDLEAVRKVWLARCIEGYDQKQAEELAKIDRIESEAWAAWERSIGKVKISTIEYAPVTDQKTGATKMSPMKGKDRTEDRAGDPRFLERISWCVERRIKMFGLDAPLELTAAELERMLQEEIGKLRAAEALKAAELDSEAIN